MDPVHAVGRLQHGQTYRTVELPADADPETFVQLEEGKVYGCPHLRLRYSGPGWFFRTHLWLCRDCGASWRAQKMRKG